MSHLICLSRSLRRGGLLVCVLTCIADASAAQPAGDELRPTDLVRVEIATGDRVVGRFVSASSDAITISVSGQPVQMPTSSVVRVERRVKDSVWNGVLIGAGIGAAAGVSGLVASQGSSGIYLMMGLAPAVVAGGAVVGWIVDRRIHRWTAIGSKRSSVASFVAPRAVGIAAAVTW